MGANGGFRFRHFHNGVGQSFHHLGFRRAPRVADLDGDAQFFKITGGHALEFRGDAPARKVFGLAVGGISGHGQHPARGAVGDLGIDKIGYHADGRFPPRVAFPVIGKIHAGFQQPVLAGQRHVKHSVPDIAGNFLHAAEPGSDVGVVDIREIVAHMLADFPPGPFKQRNGGFFKGTFGDAEFNLTRGGHGTTPLERFVFENICRPAPVFRPAGFTPPPSLCTASELRRHRRRGRRGFSLPPLD